MEENEELELEEKLIDKYKNRLDRTRKEMNIDYKLTTYDALGVFEAVNREISRIETSKERKMKQHSEFPTKPQIKLMNDLRKQTGELPINPKDFKTYEDVDKEIKRLKEKKEKKK
jgi:hypothetical protein